MRTWPKNTRIDPQPIAANSARRPTPKDRPTPESGNVAVAH